MGSRTHLPVSPLPHTRPRPASSLTPPNLGPALAGSRATLPAPPAPWPSQSAAAPRAGVSCRTSLPRPPPLRGSPLTRPMRGHRRALGRRWEAVVTARSVALRGRHSKLESSCRPRPIAQTQQAQRELGPSTWQVEEEEGREQGRKKSVLLLRLSERD
jgi:hypothetical protein